MADETLDLELRLGLGPRDAAPRSNGATAEGARADQLLSTGAIKHTGFGETSQHVAQAMRAVSDRDETEQPKSAAEVILQPPPLVEAGEEEEAAAAEQGRKRPKTEAPPANLDPPIVHQGDGDGGATEPAWVRAELLPRHALPGNLQLHFVMEKVLTQSDLKSNQSRIFILSSGSERLRPLLSAGELRHCGLKGSSRRRDTPAQGQDGAKKKKKRENKKSHPGVPVLVYERGAEREAAVLRLNSFWSTRAVVINGHGFGRFVAGSGFKKGDRVEFWAFRRPQDQHLCFVIAKWDGHRRAAINPQE